MGTNPITTMQGQTTDAAPGLRRRSRPTRYPQRAAGCQLKQQPADTDAVCLTDGQPKTLDEIGKVYGVTRERIRQIESKTMYQLRHPSPRGVETP